MSLVQVFVVGCGEWKKPAERCFDETKEMWRDMGCLILNGGEKKRLCFREWKTKIGPGNVMCVGFNAVDVGVGMKGGMNKRTNGCKRRGTQVGTGPIIIDEPHSRVQLDRVIRYALGRIHIDGLLTSHRVLPHGDARVFPPYQKTIHASESVNESVTVSGAVRALVKQVHDVDHDTLRGSVQERVRCWAMLQLRRVCCR